MRNERLEVKFETEKFDLLRMRRMYKCGYMCCEVSTVRNKILRLFHLQAVCCSSSEFDSVATIRQYSQFWEVCHFPWALEVTTPITDPFQTKKQIRIRAHPNFINAFVIHE